MSNVRPASLGWLDPSCVLAMDFDDGSARDWSNHGNHGNPSGGPGIGPGVNGGGAMTFDGSSQYMRVPYTVSLNTTIPFSASVWANSAGAGEGALLSQFGAGTYQGWMIWKFSPNYAFYVNGGVRATVAIGIGWKFITVVWDGTNAKIYSNGVQIQSSAYSIAPNNANANLIIGGYFNGGPDTGGAPTFKQQGSLDEIRIYSRALSASEIRQLYEEGLN